MSASSLLCTLQMLSLCLLLTAFDDGVGASSVLEQEDEVPSLEHKRIHNPLDTWKSYAKRKRMESPRCLKPKNGHKPSFLIRPIRRVKASEMTVEKFQRSFVHADVALPMIFERDDFDDSEWSPSSFMEQCGNIPIEDPEDEEIGEIHSVRQVYENLVGERWAGLGIPDLEELNIVTLKDLLNAQETPEGKGLYLHDAPLSWYCPPKVDKIKVPKYFPRNYDALLWDPDDLGKSAVEMENQWPSIFISKAGTGSRLHSDSRMTRFYTQVLYGAKLWRVTPPSEYWRLDPRSPDSVRSFYPTLFGADLMQPDFDKHKDLDGTLVYETIMKPGDVLFLPQGWPHQVLNLKESVMSAVNYYDSTVLNIAKECLEYEGYQTNDLYVIKAFFMPLDDPVFNGDPEQDISWTDFMRGQHLQLTKVPQWLIAKVKMNPDWMINYRDPDGYPALHVAVEYNFIELVAFLIETAGVDVNFIDRKGSTALNLAQLLEYEAMVELLLHFGALTDAQIRSKKCNESATTKESTSTIVEERRDGNNSGTLLEETSMVTSKDPAITVAASF